MPIPSRGAGESEADFMPRCMAAMAGEFPDASQRAAICHDAFRKGSRAEAAEGDPPVKHKLNLADSLDLAESTVDVEAGREKTKVG